MRVEMKSGSKHEISLGYVEVPGMMVKYVDMFLNRKIFSVYDHGEAISDGDIGHLRNEKMKKMNSAFQSRFGKGVKIKNVLIGLFDQRMEERGYVFCGKTLRYVLEENLDTEMEFTVREAQLMD